MKKAFKHPITMFIIGIILILICINFSANIFNFLVPFKEIINTKSFYSFIGLVIALILLLHYFFCENSSKENKYVVIDIFCETFTCSSILISNLTLLSGAISKYLLKDSNIQYGYGHIDYIAFIMLLVISIQYLNDHIGVKLINLFKYKDSNNDEEIADILHK